MVLFKTSINICSSFLGLISNNFIFSINDLLSSVGLEDYTKREYSMGELIDINKYINSKNKGLKK